MKLQNYQNYRVLLWKKGDPNEAHKSSEAKLTDGSTLVLYFMDRRNGWCLYRQDSEGNQIGDSECAAYKSDLMASAYQIAEEVGKCDYERSW